MLFIWYNQDIDDFFVSCLLAVFQGGSVIIINVGLFENKGVEVLFYGLFICKCDFSWDIFFNFFCNCNCVMNFGQVCMVVFNVIGVLIFLVDDQLLGVFFGIYIVCDDNGDFLFIFEGFL